MKLDDYPPAHKGRAQTVENIRRRATMASFFIPLTGLNAYSTALNTIANDLSNMNTTAYKGQTANFSDLFYQQVGSSGSGNEIQVGEGVQVAANETNFAQGSYDTSGTTSSDVALNGSGFFVVSNGSGNLYTRAGDFTQDSSGNLITSDGMTVMGYPAVNGTVNTDSSLTAINIPLSGQVQQPEATTTFSMTANLDSASPTGTTFPAPITLFDSLGVSYQATVNYTKTGTNTWSYDITVPDTVTAAPTSNAAATTMTVPASTPTATTMAIAAEAQMAVPATWTANLTPSSSVDTTANTTTFSYNFGAGGAVDGSSALSIDGQSVPISASGETVSGLEGLINTNPTLTVAGVSAGMSGNVLTITVPTSMAAAMTSASTLVGDFTGTTSNFDFNTDGTVDPTSTNLLISGQTATGASATITAPTITAGESVSDYANALTAQLEDVGITNVTVSYLPGTNQLSITGADVSTPQNSVGQDLAATTTNYDFGSTATVDPSTSFTITGQTATGAPLTVDSPAVTPDESVSDYAQALSTALASMAGVQVLSSGNRLTITGANITTPTSMSQSLQATTTNFALASSGGTVATVDPETNLTITGLTSSGSTATIAAPTVTAGELLTKYVGDLTTALANAGIAGVTVSAMAGGGLSIVGANVSTSGKVVQDALASDNASGSLTFNSSGNLVSPAADITGITFSGLSDGAANLNMTWNILGANGASTISQEDSASGLSAAPANGYAAGVYQGFTIGSDGTVTATYSNGQSQAVGQLALANVTNMQGLSLQGNGNYATTQASGTALIGVSGTDGLGTIEDSSLEESNVNISAEFSDLIIAQRAFEANAKSITTFDTVTQDTINMVH
jgi:flagellar hook protein FlgE